MTALTTEPPQLDSPPTSEPPSARGLRTLARGEFDRAYDELILNNKYVEEKGYYRRYRKRYFKTLQYFANLDLPRPAKILEVGGGQIALLAHHLFGDEGTTGDINEAYARPVTSHGLDFVVCDLVHDDVPHRDHFDVFVLCEVIEHMPIPPHIVLEKIKQWIKPGGVILLTTPNLYRLRNTLRLLTGMRVFCNWYYPPRGKGLGHPIEYSAEHMQWQLEKAGFEVRIMDHVQLTNAGSHWWSRIMRAVLAPLLLRPLWRDALVAVAVKPEE